MLWAENLVKIYGGRKVVNGVSLSVTPGEVVGLLGPNGAGKTTTFYMIVGLIRPDDGRVFLEGFDLTKLAMYERARLGIGYLAQEPSIFQKLTVEENIMAILEFLPLSGEEKEQRLNKLISDLNLEHVRKSFGYSLSGGERRRVEVARVLAIEPKYILLDEPFAGVDPIAVGEIQSIVLKMKELGLGILITDHNVRDTLRITDRAYIMSEGRILISGTPEEIAASEVARRVYLGENFEL